MKSLNSEASFHDAISTRLTPSTLDPLKLTWPSGNILKFSPRCSKLPKAVKLATTPHSKLKLVLEFEEKKQQNKIKISHDFKRKYILFNFVYRILYAVTK